MHRTHSTYSWNIKWQKCACMGLNGFHIKWIIGTHCNWKNQNPWSRFGATSQTALPIWPIWPNFEVNGLDWQCCLAGSSKTAPRILIFSIAMGAHYSFYVKSIATYAPALLGYNNSVLARVTHHFTFSQCKTNSFVDKFSQKLHELKYMHINSYFFNLMGRQLLVKIALCVPKMTSVKKNPLYFQEPRISFCSDRFVHLQL